VRSRAGTLAALSLALVLAACGGGAGENADQAAAIPGAVAKALASKSDSIAEALEAGDVCVAARRADELKHAVDAAISGGKVPVLLQGELERTATDLQNEVNCVEKDEEHDKGKGKGQDKKDETTTLGTTILETTTGEEG
jgi:hypothetical protein